MGPAAMATAALIAHVQAQCGPAPVEVLDLGVADSALQGHTMQWEGDPCGTQPVLHLTVRHDEGDRRLTVRPRLAPAARRNAAVTLVVQRGDLTLATSGTLLHDAVVGQRVRVRNDTAHTAVSGVLTGPDRVEIP